ncbi:MAG: alpha/beta hydrolase [Anaerolineae bacterium]
MPLAQINNIQLYYETHGQGAALLLVSGTGITCDIWRYHQAPAFAQAYQVIIFDHRGVGRSDKPDEAYSTRGFAADAVALLDVLGIDRAHIMGHSMGGRVAQWIALDYPERVRSLVLSSSGSGQFAPEVEVVRGLPLKQTEAMIEQGYEQWWLNHLANEDFMFPLEVRQAQPELLAQRRQLALESIPPLRPYLRHVIARQQHETSALLHRITAPTLVIVGEQDTTIGGTGNHFAAARALAQRIPGAELVVMKGAAHGYLWQMPGEANSVILDFLSRH